MSDRAARRPFEPIAGHPAWRCCFCGGAPVVAVEKEPGQRVACRSCAYGVAGPGSAPPSPPAVAHERAPAPASVTQRTLFG